MQNILEQLNLKASNEDLQKIEEIFKPLKKKYHDYSDPWGFDIETCQKALELFIPLYTSYFKVRVFGKENVEDIPYMLVSNHTGQIPLDGMLISIAFIWDISPPRVLRSMIERFMAALPFLGDFSAQTGAILGDRKNCQYLLSKGESILVFPEGVRGISKNTPDYYQVQKFSHGFYRIALGTKTPILPISVVGAEEMFPFVYHAMGLAKTLGLPSLPISANLIPLPSPIDIYIGEPYIIPEGLSAEAPDKEIREHIYKIEGQIKKQLEVGLKNRRPFLKKVTDPLSKIMNTFKR